VVVLNTIPLEMKSYTKPATHCGASIQESVNNGKDYSDMSLSICTLLGSERTHCHSDVLAIQPLVVLVHDPLPVMA